MSKRKPSAPPTPEPASPAPDSGWDPLDPVADAERRRYGRIARDERGNATVDWVKRPKDWARAQLAVIEAPLAPAAVSQPPKGYDPYESSHTGNTGSWSTRPSQLTRPARTDLRKLSEHIKQMRELKDRTGD